MKDFTKFHSDKEIAKYLISEFDNSKEEEIFSATKRIISECRKKKEDPAEEWEVLVDFVVVK